MAMQLHLRCKEQQQLAWALHIDLQSHLRILYTHCLLPCSTQPGVGRQVGQQHWHACDSSTCLHMALYAHVYLFLGPKWCFVKTSSVGELQGHLARGPQPQGGLATPVIVEPWDKPCCAPVPVYVAGSYQTPNQSAAGGEGQPSIALNVDAAALSQKTAVHTRPLDRSLKDGNLCQHARNCTTRHQYGELLAPALQPARHHGTVADAAVRGAAAPASTSCITVMPSHHAMPRGVAATTTTKTCSNGCCCRNRVKKGCEHMPLQPSQKPSAAAITPTATAAKKT